MGVRAVVLDRTQDGQLRVLLVRHGYVEGWHFPGGGVDPHETLLEALARELEEEAGLALRSEAQLHGIFHNPRAFSRDHVAVYVVRDVERVRDFSPKLEIRECVFFPVDALPPQISAGTRQRLQEILAQQPAAQVWS